MSRGLAAVAALVARVKELATPRLLAFDVDGTLAPIVDDPVAARVPKAVVRDLKMLARQRGLHVALITGRDGAQLTGMVDLLGAWRVLEHGRVILRPGQRAGTGRPGRAGLDRLEGFEAWARNSVCPAGAILERKDTSRAVHVRELARRRPALARKILRQAKVEAKRRGLFALSGRSVMEARLFGCDKGVAFETLVRRARCRGVLFVGDDRTDHPAIASALRLGGLGIFVRSAERPRAPRGASGSLVGPPDVHALVSTLARELGRT